ncbi:MAG TPA: MYXO-CTERM sorting domain-containing protein [Myxococcales bacterium]|nr:MYXO-CTERM sorting domain-containing protein [Myxococcales bacterium]
MRSIGVLVLVALPASAATWVQLGSSLNLDATKSAGSPAIAATTSSLYVGWVEPDAAGADQMYVKSWNGNAWVQLGGSLNVQVSGYHANEPSLVLFGSTLYASWWEYPVGGGTCQGHVKKWSGTAWVAAATNEPGSTCQPVPLATDGTTLYVANANQHQLYKLASGRWSSIGSQWTSGFDLSTSMVMHGSSPELAYTIPYYPPGSSSSSYVDAYATRLGGSTWTQLGATYLNLGHPDSASSASIASNGVADYVAWSEKPGTKWSTYVASWSGSAWTLLGGAQANPTNVEYLSPRVFVQGPTPYLAYLSAAGQKNQAYVSSWTGSAWSVLGGALNVNTQKDASGVAATGAGASTYATWSEGAGLIYVKQWTTTTGGTATQLAFSVQPSNAAAGAAITPALQVAVQDALGAVVTSSAATITLAIGNNAGGGTLSGTATATAVNGVATFSGLSINRTGTGYTLVASSAGLSSATSAPFNITTGAPAALAFTVQPSSTPVGSAISPPVQVAVRDSSGNTVTSSSAPVSMTTGANPSGGVLSGTLTASADAGVASFGNLSLNQVGTGYTLIASSAGLPDAGSAPFNVDPAGAVKLAFTVQPSTTAAGSPITPAVQVTVQDATGTRVASTANVTVTIGNNPAGGTLSGTATARADAGVAVFSDLSIDNAGAGYTLAAASGTLAGAASASFGVGAGAAAQLVFLGGSQATTAGTCSPVLTVQSQDALANPAPVAGPLALTSTSTAMTFYASSDATCSGAPSTAVALASGTTGSFRFRDTAAGTPVITASAGGGVPPASQPETVRPAPPSRLAFTSAAAPVVAGACSGPLTVEALDPFGNPSPVGGDMPLGLSSTSATMALTGDLTCSATGAAAIPAGATAATFAFQDTVAASPVITAAANGFQAASQTQVVVAGPPARLDVSGFPASVAAGAPGTVTVSARDPYANVVAAYRGTVQLSSSDPAATLPGPYAFSAADQGAHAFAGGVTLRTVGVQQIAAADVAGGSLQGAQTGIQVLQPPGGACDANATCSTGICSTGVCCTTQCGQCQKCDPAGACQAIPDCDPTLSVCGCGASGEAPPPALLAALGLWLTAWRWRRRPASARQPPRPRTSP